MRSTGGDAERSNGRHALRLFEEILLSAYFMSLMVVHAQLWWHYVSISVKFDVWKEVTVADVSYYSVRGVLTIE